MSETLQELLREAAAAAAAFRSGGAARPHRPDTTYAESLARFAEPTPEQGAPDIAVLRELIERAAPGLSAMTGPRFFGWVIGGTAPAGLAADWLTAAWGQNAGNHEASPSAAAAEAVAAGWLLDLLDLFDLPREASVGFVTGGTMANFTGLAAGRSEMLRRVGWDVEADGLFGAPPLTVILGEEAHSTVFSALRYLGLGDRRVVSVPADANGAMRAEDFARALARIEGPALAVAQAGHLHSGAFDPIAEIAPLCRARGVWLHVDGAFGLWARAAASTRALAAGVELADSWAVDGHKWLQTPHDCGYVIVRDPEAHRRAMRLTASYLPASGAERNPADLAPELSRRARGFATWAMIKALGREGIAAMVERHCALARRMAERVSAEPGVRVLNDVALNQVAVRFGADLDPAEADRLTDRAIARIQADGECFIGGALWRGVKIVRVSVINALTTEADIDRGAEAMLRVWRAVRAAA